MDEIVLQAMTKWPSVPDCYGWLGFDGRGDWYMRDEATQALGAFGSGMPNVKGSRLHHAKLIAFIDRNYAVDARGCWYFQNGPQRVYVELELAPRVWRVNSECEVVSSSGLAVTVLDACIDRHDHLYLNTSMGIGLVHTADMLNAAENIERGAWGPVRMLQESPERTFNFIKSPVALGDRSVRQN